VILHLLLAFYHLSNLNSKAFLKIKNHFNSIGFEAAPACYFSSFLIISDMHTIVYRNKILVPNPIVIILYAQSASFTWQCA